MRIGFSPPRRDKGHKPPSGGLATDAGMTLMLVPGAKFFLFCGLSAHLLCALVRRIFTPLAATPKPPGPSHPPS
jgi:hypothetical protein